jgi:hypothetical protein
MINKSAILGSLMGLICLFLPWWQYAASSMGLKVDFTVNPWGYGGSVGGLANALSTVGGSVGSSGLSTLSGTLRVAGLLVAVGSFFGMGGALIRGSGGRVSVALASILNVSGVVVFFSAMGQIFSAAGLAATGSTSLELYGYSLGSADWGWTYGLFLGGLASMLLLVGIVTHPEPAIPTARLRPIQPFISVPISVPSASAPVLASMSRPRYASPRACPRCSKTVSTRAMFCNRCGNRL